MVRDNLANWDQLYSQDFDAIRFEELEKIINLNHDASSFIERYSCKCRKKVGMMNRGTLCGECKTLVKLHYMDGDTAWIDISPYYIILPSAYKKISGIVSDINLKTIIDTSVETRVDQFQGIGINGLKDRFDEIISCFDDEYFRLTSDFFDGDTLNMGKVLNIPVFSYKTDGLEFNRDTRRDIRDELDAFKDRVFVSHIPASDFVCRRYPHIWEKYVELDGLAKSLNYDTELSIDENFDKESDKLFEIQMKMDQIYKELTGLSHRSPKIN